MWLMRKITAMVFHMGSGKHQGLRSLSLPLCAYSTTALAGRELPKLVRGASWDRRRVRRCRHQRNQIQSKGRVEHETNRDKCSPRGPTWMKLGLTHSSRCPHTPHTTQNVLELRILLLQFPPFWYDMPPVALHLASLYQESPWVRKALFLGIGNTCHWTPPTTISLSRH